MAIRSATSKIGVFMPPIPRRLETNSRRPPRPIFPKSTTRRGKHVNLPHTVRLEPLNASGGRNYQGLCWYRKHFSADNAWRGRKIYLKFEGTMHTANVWINGVALPTHYGGYLPFTLDISQFVRYGADNVLTVRLNNANDAEVPPGKPQNQLDFVYFGGLYRNVHLEVLSPLHITDPILSNTPAGGGHFRDDAASRGGQFNDARAKRSRQRKRGGEQLHRLTATPRARRQRGGAIIRNRADCGQRALCVRAEFNRKKREIVASLSPVALCFAHDREPERARDRRSMDARGHSQFALRPQSGNAD